jgi:hypothetical protein
LEEKKLPGLFSAADSCEAAAKQWRNATIEAAGRGTGGSGGSNGGGGKK